MSDTHPRNPWNLEPDVFFRLLPLFLGRIDRDGLRLVVRHPPRRPDRMWTHWWDGDRRAIVPVGYLDPPPLRWIFDLRDPSTAPPRGRRPPPCGASQDIVLIRRAGDPAGPQDYFYWPKAGGSLVTIGGQAYRIPRSCAGSLRTLGIYDADIHRPAPTAFIACVEAATECLTLVHAGLSSMSMAVADRISNGLDRATQLPALVRLAVRWPDSSALGLFRTLSGPVGPRFHVTVNILDLTGRGIRSAIDNADMKRLDRIQFSWRANSTLVFAGVLPVLLDVLPHPVWSQADVTAHIIMGRDCWDVDDDLALLDRIVRIHPRCTCILDLQEVDYWRDEHIAGLMDRLRSVCLPHIRVGIIYGTNEGERSRVISALLSACLPVAISLFHRRITYHGFGDVDLLEEQLWTRRTLDSVIPPYTYVSPVPSPL